MILLFNFYHASHYSLGFLNRLELDHICLYLDESGHHYNYPHSLAPTYWWNCQGLILLPLHWFWISSDWKTTLEASQNKIEFIGFHVE